MAGDYDLGVVVWAWNLSNDDGSSSLDEIFYIFVGAASSPAQFVDFPGPPPNRVPAVHYPGIVGIVEFPLGSLVVSEGRVTTVISYYDNPKAPVVTCIYVHTVATFFWYTV